VGNGAYEHTIALANPVNDAEAIAAALERLGFAVVVATDGSQAAMEASIRDFARQARGAELALFFYAGHGLQVDGVNYLIPVDALLESETDLAFAAIDLNDVLDVMTRSAQASLVFLDACRDNPMADALARSVGARSTDIGRGLAQVQGAAGALIAYATQPGNVALDGQGAHSPFTAALLQHVETPGLELRQVLTRVRDAVMDATGGQQVPWDHSSLRGDVYLVPASAAPAAAPVATGAEVWQVIQHSSNAKDFELFLQSFPDSPFAPYAELRLDALAAAARAHELQQALAAVEAKLAAEERARAEAEAKLASEAAARAAFEAEAKRLAEAAALAEASIAATEQARQAALTEAGAARQEREAAEAALQQAVTDKASAGQALAEAERKTALAAEELARAEAEAQRLAEEAALARAAAAANDQARQDALKEAETAKADRAAAEQALQAAEERSAAAQESLEQVQADAAAAAAVVATQAAAAAAAAATAAAAVTTQPAPVLPADDAAAVRLAALEADEAGLNLDKTGRARVQRALTLVGYDTRGVDGAFGKNSRAAISAYQTSADLPATGYLDPATLAHLMRQAEPKLAAWDKAEAERVAAEAATAAAVEEAVAVVRNVTPALVASVAPSIEGRYAYGKSGNCYGNSDWTVSVRVEGNLIRERHNFAGQSGAVVIDREILSITQQQVDAKLYRQIDTVVVSSFAPAVKEGTPERYRFTFTGHYLQLKGFKRC